MKKCSENIILNNRLRALYLNKTNEFLGVLGDKKQNRINEFGIIDIHNYNADRGILFIGKETNGWGVLREETFLDWINDIITGQQKTKRPQIWYNLGRWAKFIVDPTIDKKEIVNEKVTSLSGLRKIAFTNVNKVGGGSVSGNEFWELTKEDITRNLLIEEIYILKPKVIVLCGLKRQDIGLENIDKGFLTIEMPHPSARNISKLDMLSRLENQLKEAGWGGCYE